MSEGFSAGWLALREPYDRAARDPGLVGRLAEWRRGRRALAVLDLGAGTGATRRALAGGLGGEQHWTLVEHDPVLIAAGGSVGYRRLDLARDLEALSEEPCDIITASALIDLVSAEWLERLVRLRRVLGAALYIALTYDGRIAWSPADPFDAAILALVNRHQRGDKGFGPALGPEAAPWLAARLAGEDGCTLLTRSDWRLRDMPIQAELLQGYAAAAAELDGDPTIRAWHDRRLKLVEAGQSSLTVGHLDLLFLPGSPACAALSASS